MDVTEMVDVHLPYFDRDAPVSHHLLRVMIVASCSAEGQASFLFCALA